jgi:hypothetical protein
MFFFRFLLEIDKIDLFKSDENESKYFLGFTFKDDSNYKYLDGIVKQLNKTFMLFNLPHYFEVKFLFFLYL